MTPISAFAWAAGAGLAISVLDLAALVQVPRRRRRVDFSDPAYLLKFLGHPLVGGFLAAAYAASRPTATPPIAILLGAAAPVVWRSIVRSGAAIAGSLLGHPPSDP